MQHIVGAAFVALVTAPGVLAGVNTVRLRNTGITPVDDKARMVSSMAS